MSGILKIKHFLITLITTKKIDVAKGIKTLTARINLKLSLNC